RLIIGSSSPFFDKVTDRYFDYAIKMLQLPEDEWLAYRKDILRATITSILSRWVSQGMKESKEDLAVWITEILISNWAPISSRP
ncbi:MAG: TetR-like C-terminal domain-containing protein, partial [Emergencia sp.]